MRLIKSIGLSFAFLIISGITSAHCLYIGQSISRSQSTAIVLSMYFAMMLIDSAFISFGLYCIEIKTIYYASIIIYPLFAFLGILIASSYDMFDYGAFYDVGWLFTIFVSYVFIFITTGIYKITGSLLRHDV